jgi:dihydroneopterin aldolase/D-erythro-7,8-dihydroneopterin triphosphate epimerase
MLQETHYQSPDKIRIKELLVRCIIGLNPDEREKKQDVVINLTLYTDLRAAGETDDITKTVDYKTITKQVIALAENSSYYLLEKLAQEIARLCLGHELVQAVLVSLDKPGALRFAKSACVEIYQEKEEKVIKGFK